MYIGLLFNDIWMFCSESEIRWGLYRSHLTRKSAVTVSEGTPRSLKPTQLLFINRCLCAPAYKSSTPMCTHLHTPNACFYKHTHKPQRQHQSLKLLQLLVLLSLGSRWNSWRVVLWNGTYGDLKYSFTLLQTCSQTKNVFKCLDIALCNLKLKYYTIKCMLYYIKKRF